MKIKTSSTKETQTLASQIAKQIKNGGVVALYGKLGAGKTIFAQGFAKDLGISEKIISPTFVLIRQHPIPNTKQIFYHIDLYRLEDTKGIGIEEIINNKENIVLIEWADRLENLPKNAIKITIEKLSADQRQITIENPAGFL